MNETNEHNPDTSPKWLCVVCDPESYDTIFCADIVEGWKQANYFTPEDADPEEVECFRRFMYDEDNWWRDPWGKLAKLRWNVGGESCGTVTFYRIDEDRSQSARIAELERRVGELTEEKNTYESHMLQAEGRVATLRSDVERLTKEVASYQQVIRDEYAKREALDSQLAEREEDRKAWLAELDARAARAQEE